MARWLTGPRSVPYSVRSSRKEDDVNRREFLAASSSFGVALPGSQITPAPAGAGALRAGFAERDISPEIGMEMPGGYGKSYHKEFHDPCKVRAAVFDDGERRVALVGVDALELPRSLVEAARAGVHTRCGILRDHVLIGASHSHSSGPVGMVEPGQFDHASPLVRKLAYEQSSMSDAAYAKRVEEQIEAAVVEAHQRRAESRAGFGSGFEDKVAFNRRFRMKNGLTYTHPGKGNPDILAPAGPVDPEVGVIGVWDAANRLTGCIVNYCCHATTNPGGISANWIYYLERAIRGFFGEEVVVVFLQGFSGDVTQVNNLSLDQNPGAEEWAQLVGGRVGAEAVRTLLGMAPGTGRVDARSRVLEMRRRVPSPDRLRRCLEIVRKDPSEVGDTTWIFAKEIVLLDALIARWPTVEVEVQAVQVGPVVCMAMPGEMFCQLGLDLRRARLFPFTWPVELANGSAGYIPTEEALGPGGGGYETRLTSYSNLEPAAGRRMVEAALELARSLTPGQIPTPSKVAPFRSFPGGIGPAPWDYGNVPPELA